MSDLLYEIGVEEVPASYIRPALDALEAQVLRELDEAGLGVDASAVRTTGTPRRLVLAITGLAEGQADADEEIMGPPAKVAFDADGNPTRAAEGFARKQGVDASLIQRKTTDRGEYCCLQIRREGRPTADVLAEILPRATLAMPFPKSMRWPGSDDTFTRPVRYLTALLGSEVVAFTLFSLTTGRTVEGHPILDPGTVELQSADYNAYRETLRSHKVEVEMDVRRREIERAVTEADGKVSEQWLIDEVTNLVQWPSITVGGFDPAYLEVPAAVIEAAMMEHQRYFPVYRDDALQPNFVVVSDRGPEPSDAVRIGNEEVLRARLADARFFYQVDRKTKLEDRLDGLKGVQFLKGLGNYHDKIQRMAQLVGKVADALGLDADTAAHARRAALLCKADLLTEMVGEFPKLQGQVGSIYAHNDSEPDPVVDAIVEHYLPKSADGALPHSATGAALSLTEKLDNMIGCFAMGLIPTGSADPYAMRRQGQAALRLIEQVGCPVDLAALLCEAQALLPAPHCDAADAVPKLLEFLQDRLFVMAIGTGAPHDLIKAVLAADEAPWHANVADFYARLKAVRALAKDDAWPGLVSAVERTHNISKDAPADVEPDAAHYAEPLEEQLGALYSDHRDAIGALITEGKYEEASRTYAEAFAAPLQKFFDEVFVNVDDLTVRRNRLALIRAVNRLYAARIADLSQIVTGVS